MSPSNYFVLNKGKNKITMILSLFAHCTPLLSLACNTSPIKDLDNMFAPMLPHNSDYCVMIHLGDGNCSVYSYSCATS